jgi:(E)-4-hydroxy-3-methylbut-2-enyl-diphosphate synthase
MGIDAIGTNHGSERSHHEPLRRHRSGWSRAHEFARIARDLDYHELIFSMKASNPKVMIEAYRLLVARLDAEGPDWNYPVHLGVTEAGDGEDGRIKSAIGIGSLLADGIGDTIRVSLTEDSVHEVPVARALVEAVSVKTSGPFPPCGKRDIGATLHVSAPSIPDGVGGRGPGRRRGTGSRCRAAACLPANRSQDGSAG